MARRSTPQARAAFFLFCAGRALAIGCALTARRNIALAEVAIRKTDPAYYLFGSYCAEWIDLVVRLAKLQNERRAKGGA